jgi:hypothetical protein
VVDGVVDGRRQQSPIPQFAQKVDAGHASCGFRQDRGIAPLIRTCSS